MEKLIGHEWNLQDMKNLSIYHNETMRVVINKRIYMNFYWWKNIRVSWKYFFPIPPFGLNIDEKCDYVFPRNKIYT